MSQQTKKHFEAMAASIRQIRDRKKRETRIEECITQFIKSNPQFDQDRFRAFCSPGAEKKIKSKLALPPDVSYTYKVDVDTSRWWPKEVVNQWDKIHAVSYKGVRHVIDSDECRWTRYYSKGHAWAGQHECSGIDVRHVFEQFTEMTGKYGCGKDGRLSGSPDYTVKDFLSDFLFNVEYAEGVEACTAYQVRMTYEVKMENRAKFEKSLAFISNVLRNVKFEWSKDQPKED